VKDEFANGIVDRIPVGITVAIVKDEFANSIIGWVDPQVEWYQVRILGTANPGGATTLTGYLQRTNTAGSAMFTIRCTSSSSLATLTPDPGMLTSGLSQFADRSPQAHVFNGSQPASTMGTCGVHIGVALPCSPNPSSGSTIDVVPRNIELCIDSRTSTQLVQCNPGWSSPTDPNLNPNPVRVPVYAPRDGCAIFNNLAGEEPPSIIIRIDRYSTQTQRNTAIQVNDRFIVLTHVIGAAV
jgi:hypothetical protein